MDKKIDFYASFISEQVKTGKVDVEEEHIEEVEVEEAMGYTSQKELASDIYAKFISKQLSKKTN
jgi:hypothetical protein